MLGLIQVELEHDPVSVLCKGTTVAGEQGARGPRPWAGAHHYPMTQLLEKLVIDRIGSPWDIEKYVAIHRDLLGSSLSQPRETEQGRRSPIRIRLTCRKSRRPRVHIDQPVEVTQLRASVMGMTRAVNMNTTCRARPIQPLASPKRTARRP